MLSRFLFLFHRRRGQQKERTTGGADNRRRGQQKERTTEGEDNGRSGQGSITFRREFFNKKGRFLFENVVFKRVVFDLI